MARKSVAIARKILIFSIGFPLLILGIILIPLPGPGILVSLIALFILSLEFDWADRHFQVVRKRLDALIEKGRDRQKRMLEKYEDKDDKK